MEIKSMAGGKMILEHSGRNGAVKLEIMVDNDSRAFIKKNIGKMTYDKTNDVLRVVDDNKSTTLARAYAESRNILPSYRNVMFRDGNKWNLKSKNLYIYE